MGSDFHIEVRHYGPTVHLTPVGALDVGAAPGFDPLRYVLGGDVCVVVCDMRHVPFMDLPGLHRLLDLGRRARARGIALFVCNWRRQPLCLLDRIDEVGLPGADRGRPAGLRRAVTHDLRRTLATPGPDPAPSPVSRASPLRTTEPFRAG
ncbi:STAS domain-containing protein [Streptomyces sp. NPDC051555]|uniref:STAS domain-containing protein n=1 Tax=Streptomyces sp. NPDC051555 TaxID=3365657 RepID=UPI0037AA71A2